MCSLVAPRNFKLVLEYDGTDFAGWQVQPGRRTVQGTLETAVLGLRDAVASSDAEGRAGSDATGDRVPVTGAGRTDAGVHALGQVANVKIPNGLPPERLAAALNARLPRDLLVLSASEVPLSFNARFDARSRTYHYLMSAKESPIWRHRRWHVRYALDAEPMREAAEALLGEHDFSSFSIAGSEPEHHRCRVNRISLEWEPAFGGLLVLRIEANRFLRGMVRSIVGTLVDVGRGRTDPEQFVSILEAQDRSRAGATAPAHGLYLVEVEYD